MHVAALAILDGAALAGASGQLRLDAAARAGRLAASRLSQIIRATAARKRLPPYQPAAEFCST